MPFWRVKHKTENRYNQIKQTEPLRAGNRSKRTWLPRSFAGSMTVEAALVLPLFLFFISNILFIFDMVRLQSRMLSALHETGKQTAEYSYFFRYATADLMSLQAGENLYDGEMGADLGELGGAVFSFFLSETYVRKSVETFLGTDYLDHTCLDGGAGAISYLRSDILASGDIIDITADYRVRPFIPVFGLQNFSMQSRYYAHAWVGYDVGGELPDAEGKENEKMVYITETGTVYHLDRNCTYLQPSIHTSTVLQLESERNTSGGRYYPCEICHPPSTGSVLITDTGNRYHSSTSCPGLKRTVHEVPLSSVEGKMPPCSKCGGTEND
jgi:hypothetical protein